MALVYSGTNVSGVKDKPAGYSQGAIAVPATITYTRSLNISVDKAAVDTDADDVVNFTALVAAVDVDVTAAIAADFDETLNTVNASGVVTSFNLIGGAKYSNTDNTGSYECICVTQIEVILI